MNHNRIYHNPRCSKSRATLQLLEERSAEVEVVEYLKTPPMKEELDAICMALDLEPLALIRTKETLFQDLGLSADDQRSRDEWLALMVENPQLIERPIVVYNGKVALGRPPENVLDILT
ncbi:arsenate reductase (glutaredoxin) [Chloroflexi bacterium TSY]|nr:arsenate reductase (glutaredoxin) [Chloroflexi bacterium TSY]